MPRPGRNPRPAAGAATTRPPRMLDDPARLAALWAAAVPDTRPEPAFDHLTALAREALRAARAYVAVVDAERHVVTSCAPVDGMGVGRGAVPIEWSFCRHVVIGGAPVRVADARVDPAWRDIPGTGAYGVVAYLGVPVALRTGHVVGSLCVLDGEPRAWTDHDVLVLRGVAAAVGREFDLRAAASRLAEREGEVRAREARLRAMNAATPVGVFEAGLDGMVRYVNPRLCELWGLTEGEMLGRGWQARVHVDDLAPLLADWERAAAAGEEFARRFRLLAPRAPGAAPEPRWVRSRGAPLRDHDGRVMGVVGTAEDVTARHRAEVTQRRLTQIIEAMPDVVTVSTPAGRVEYLNAAGRRLLGVAGGSDAVRAAGLRVRDVQPQFAPGGADASAVATAIVDGAWRGESTLTKGDGRELPVEQLILAHRGDGGDVEYLSSVLRDITDRRQADATLRASALVDELTGLYNRRGFLALAERECDAARAAGEGAVLAYVDLDGFKAINDAFGHAEGDRALQAVAAVLRRAFREADVVGRLGGDEFVAFGRCGTGAAAGGPLDGARATAARLRQRVERLLAEESRTIARPYALAGSAGVAVFDPATPATVSTLLLEADVSLYDRKRARKRVGVAA